MDAPGEENVLPSTSNICRICLKQSSRYTCPRCNTPYCTLTCYKSKDHANCSETFYKENFLQALKETKGSSEDKRKILEILQRVEDSKEDLDSDDDSDETAESLEKRLAGLDLDGDADRVWERLTDKEKQEFEEATCMLETEKLRTADDGDADRVWERLTDKEKQEFEEVLKVGTLGELLDAWTPWWTYHERGLIVDLQPKPNPVMQDSTKPQDTPSESGTPSEIPDTPPHPDILERIPKLSDLLKSTRPSDLVVYNITNVLYCYAYITRLHNGAHFELPLQATQGILDLSQVLSSNHNFSSTEEATQSAINNITLNPAYVSSNLLTISILQDVIHILLGQSKDAPLLYTLAALSDLHRLLSTAKKNIEKDTKLSKSSSRNNSKNAKEATIPAQDKMRSMIFQSRKKVEFFLSWTCKCGKFLKPVAAELQLIYKSRFGNEEEHSKHQAILEKAWGGHTKPEKPTNSLIQEL